MIIAAVRNAVQELQQAHGWLNDLIIELTRLLNRRQAHAHRAKPHFVQAVRSAAKEALPK